MTCYCGHAAAEHDEDYACAVDDCPCTHFNAGDPTGETDVRRHTRPRLPHDPAIDWEDDR